MSDHDQRPPAASAATAASAASAAYTALSHRHAQDGDLRMAQLAAWAGDVHVLEELLWESGLAQAPDPAAELAVVGESVAAAIEELAATLPDGSLTARAVVEAAREALVTTFDESVHGLLLDRLADLAQLDVHGSGSGPDRRSRTAARLDGRTPDALAAELRTAAGDCATMAGLLAADGEPEAARRLDHQADTAAFEAYLVGAALAAGDQTLVTVDLRWDLATGAVEAAGEPGPHRERFAAVVGSVERDALARTFGPAAR